MRNRQRRGTHEQPPDTQKSSPTLRRRTVPRTVVSGAREVSDGAWGRETRSTAPGPKARGPLTVSPSAALAGVCAVCAVEAGCLAFAGLVGLSSRWSVCSRMLCRPALRRGCLPCRAHGARVLCCPASAVALRGGGRLGGTVTVRRRRRRCRRLGLMEPAGRGTRGRCLCCLVCVVPRAAAASEQEP